MTILKSGAGHQRIPEIFIEIPSSSRDRGTKDPCLPRHVKFISGDIYAKNLDITRLKVYPNDRVFHVKLLIRFESAYHDFDRYFIARNFYSKQQQQKKK